MFITRSDARMPTRPDSRGAHRWRPIVRSRSGRYIQKRDHETLVALLHKLRGLADDSLRRAARRTAARAPLSPLRGEARRGNVSVRASTRLGPPQSATMSPAYARE